MAWVDLLIAGLAEVWWATTMKMSGGFTKFIFSFVSIGGMLVCFGFLIRATMGLPLSIAYPVWTGIGAVGAILAGIILFNEHISLLTWLFVILLVIGILGIKMTSGH